MQSHTALTPQQTLAAMLDQHRPQRLLIISASPVPAIDAHQQASPECELFTASPGPLTPELSAKRYDLAILGDCLEHLPKAQGLQLLAGIRNLNANKVALLIDLQAGDWLATDFYALGMQAKERFERDGQALHLFTYDLMDYKQVPDWLNAKFWANPQLFGKYWW